MTFQTCNFDFINKFYQDNSVTEILVDVGGGGGSQFVENIQQKKQKTVKIKQNPLLMLLSDIYEIC